MATISNGSRFLGGTAASIDGDVGSNAAGANGADSTQAVWAWKVDLAGIFLRSSENSMDVVGYRADELIGRSADQLMDTTELARCEISQVEAGGWSGLVVQARHRNGVGMWFVVTGRPVCDDNGDTIGFEGYSRRLAIDAQRIMAEQIVRRRVEEMLDLELLSTVFQPIVDLSTGIVIGVEALTRFSVDADRAPDRWFADAASVGLGTELELLAIGRALRTAEALPEHLHVSVNASPEVCLDPRLPDLIRRGKIDLRRIVIELTEHTPVVDYLLLDRSLRGLRTQGVRIAVDDAGAGFSSLQHILQLKPALIKLDRQVVANLDVDRSRQALGAAMVSFADHIGAHVVAEGIETSEELQMARRLGMTAVQGFLLGRPTADRDEWDRWQSAFVLPPSMGENTMPTFPSQPGASDTADGLRRRADRDSSFLYVAADVFDALPDPTVVVDRSGVITATNRAWRSFGARNGGGAELSGVGVNYLDVCRRAADAGDRDAKEVFEGLTSVLDGDLDESDREYPCLVAGSVHWYLSRITSLGPAGGAIAAHLRIPVHHPDIA